jgi:hypothetical protein
MNGATRTTTRFDANDSAPAVLASRHPEAHTPPVDDPRLKKLRLMVKQAINLRAASEQLIAEINEQLHHHDPAFRRLVPPGLDRVLKPRP